MKIQLSLLIFYKADMIIISFNITCSRHYIAKKIARLVLNTNHSLILLLQFVEAL